MRIVALLQSYNEQRFIGDCLDHLGRHGISAYLVDNESTDQTVAIAERRLGQNLIGIETRPRDGTFALYDQMVRKEELAQTLEADWFMHIDADEFRVTTEPGCSLAQAIERVDEAGYNAINFIEFAFLPTREAPEHDHADYLQTMRSYYPILPRMPHRLNAWKRQDGPVELARSGGHVVRFPGLKMAPESMYSRHYQFLSLDQAAEKYGRTFAPAEIDLGWHAWRANVDPAAFTLPREAELRTYVADHLLDPSKPRIHVAELLGQNLPEALAPSRPSLARRSRRWLRRAAGLNRARHSPTG